jgi:hypothetical protein
MCALYSRIVFLTFANKIASNHLSVHSLIVNYMGFNLSFVQYDDVTTVPNGKVPITQCPTV